MIVELISLPEKGRHSIPDQIDGVASLIDVKSSSRTVYSYISHAIPG